MTDASGGERAAGWYEDPYDSTRKRLWDGTRWTTEAVSKDVKDPDRLYESTRNAASPEEMREQEWLDQFPVWDTAIPRQGEHPLELRGGVPGTDIEMNARFLTRLNARSQFLYVLGVLFVIVALSLIFANLAVGLAVLLLGLVIAVAIARSRRRRRARSA